jgi:hypothetical protein
MIKKIAHRIGGRDDEYLQSRVVDGIKAFEVTHGIARFLNARQLFNITCPTERNITDLADLAKGTDITLHGGISPVLSDVRTDGECSRVNVSAAKMVERRFGLAEGCLQVTRPAQGAVERLNSDDPARYELSVLPPLTTRDDGTYENNVIANSTKYATLASNGRAVLSECMMV